MLDAASALPDEECVKNRPVSHGNIENTLAHVFQADRVWLSRVSGGDRKSLRSPDEPEHTIELLRLEWPAVKEGWLEWAKSIEDFDAPCEYRNLKGDPFRTPLKRIVLHIVNHGSVHFGQATAMLRQCVVTPPPIDLIYLYREL